MVKENKYQDALSLALSFYEGKAKAVVGLAGSSKTRKSAVAQLVSGVKNEKTCLWGFQIGTTQNPPVQTQKMARWLKFLRMATNTRTDIRIFVWVFE